MATVTLNPTSRLRKWICACATHRTDRDSQSRRNGPYVIRCAGDALRAICADCKQPFTLAMEAPTGKRRIIGCAHVRGTCACATDEQDAPPCIGCGNPSEPGLVSAGGSMGICAACAGIDADDPAPY